MTAFSNPKLRRIGALLLFCCLLAPAFYLIANNQDFPLFGYPHDDGLYFVSAKSVAAGTGYRIESLPGQPFQTKYPPGLPTYLSIAWLLNPNFPENLQQVSWLQAVWLPLFLALSLWHWHDWGFTGWRRWLLGAVLATNTYVVYFTVTAMSELPFAVFLLLTLLLLRLAERSPERATRLLLAAGLTAGIAFLFRTAGVVLLVSVPILLWRQRRLRDAKWFVAAMFPSVLAWTLWSMTHQPPGSDVITLYYTKYLGYHLSVFHLAEAHLFFWVNFDSLLAGIGGLILPTVLPGMIAHIASQVMGVAALVGISRLWRRDAARDYTLFGLLFCLMMIAWSFPPNERFVVPLAPLIWAGFLSEVLHLATAIRKKMQDRDMGQRVAAGLIGVVGVLLLGLIGDLQYELRFEMLPQLMQSERVRLANDREAYGWIRANLPEQAPLQAGYDTVEYLYTGRRAASLISPVTYFYHQDEPGRIAYLSKAPELSRAAGLKYIYLSPNDYRSDMDPQDKVKLGANIAKSEELDALKTFPGGTLYQIRETARAAR